MSTRTDAAQTSGTSPGRRIHLLGAGAVGRALLRRIAGSRHTLVGVTDSTGTIAGTSVDPHDIADWKTKGRSLANHAECTGESWTSTIDAFDADIVIDATSSEPRDGWSSLLHDTVVEAERGLVLVAKTALAERSAAWLSAAQVNRIGFNAVLGGTGYALARDLVVLKRSCLRGAIVGNASTTAIITCIERGASFEDGIAEAARLGFLESDPELDLRGTDAAVKLAIVAGAITGLEYDPCGIAVQDIRAIDPIVLRDRARDGLTTRLVARFDRAERVLNVAYEAVALDSVLAPPAGRVVYEYDTGDGDRRINIGTGLGAEATADAAWLDVQALARGRSTRIAAEAGAR
jgi:homoserine dehydrogenase